MSKIIFNTLWLSLVFLIFGGKDALFNVWSSTLQFLGCFLPIFGRQAIENYLTSPFFITKIIMIVASIVGFWLGRRRCKVLYQIVALIVVIFSLVGLGVDIF